MSENIITDQPEELAEILTVSTSNSFQFSLVLVFQRRFCQLQINLPLMASLYIHNLKINAKLQERTLAR